MSIAEEYVHCIKDVFRDGRTKISKNAAKRYHEIIKGATDEELQEIADRMGEDIEELKDRRKRFRETFDESK